MSKDVTETSDKVKPVAHRPDVDLTKREPAAIVDTTRADTADLVKKGVVTNLTITDSAASTPDAVTKDAQLLHQTIMQRGTFGISSNPDVQAMERILDPKNAAERAAVEAKYGELYGTKFRDDLRTYVGGDGANYRTVEAMLNRHDGRTNFGGNVLVALETAKQDPEKGNRLLRTAVGSLNSDQISQMATDMQKSEGAKAPMDLVPANATEQQRHELTLGRELAASGRKPANAQETAALNSYQKAYVDHVIAEAPGITDANRQVLSIMTKGVDKRTAEDIKTMAGIAINSKDLKMFADAVNGDTPAALAARKQLAGDPAFTAKYNETFSSGWTSQTQKDIAADLLSEGKVSLATIIKGDTHVLMGLLDNPKNLDLAASNSTVQERQEFTTGKELVLAGHEPTNDQERAAVAYYKKIDQAMTDTGMSAKQRAVVEDELQHGGKTLISRLAERDLPSTMGFIGGGHTTQDLMSTIEHMPASDYKLLQDKAYVRDLENSIGTYEKNEDVQLRANRLIAAKAAAPNFEASQGIKRTVWQVYQDTRTGGATGENLASAIATMSPSDAAMYKSDAAYRKTVDDIVQNNLYNDAKYLATSTLQQVAQTGKPPELTVPQQIAKSLVDGGTPLERLPLVEKMMQDPALRARLSKPWPNQTDEEKAISSMIGEAIPLTPDARKTLMTDGTISPFYKKMMGVPNIDLYSEVSKLPEDMRAKFAHILSPDDQAILNKVIAQKGEVRLEDRVRAIVVDGGSPKDLQAEMAKLKTNEQKLALASAYEAGYKGNLSNDFMPKVDAEDKEAFQRYLSPSSDGNQQLFDHVLKTDGQASFAFDASAQTIDRGIEVEKGLLSQYQALKKQLPPEMQAQISQMISTAVAQNKEAPIEEIKSLGKAAVDIAAVVATVASLGALSELAFADAALTSGEIIASNVAKKVVERTALGVAERTAAVEPAAALEPVAVVERATAVVEPAAERAAVSETAAVEPVAERAVVSETAAVEPAAERAVVSETAAVEPAVPVARAIATDALPTAEKVIAAVKTTEVLAATVAAAAVATEIAEKKLEPKPEPVPPPAVPGDKLMQLATVRRGEGPYQSAERILKADGKKHSIDEVMALTRALQHNFSPERNGHKDMKGLKVNYQFITKENFAAVVTDVKDPKVKALLMQFAAAS